MVGLQVKIVQVSHPMPDQITLRRKVYDVLETTEKRSKLSSVIDIGLVVLIVVNILSVVLESVESMNSRFGALFEYIEIFSVAVFTIEYLMRLWVCPEDPIEGADKNPRLKHMRSPMAVIDILAILPFYLTYLFAIDLRFLRVLRLLRILKLTRYSSAMTMLLDVFKEEASAFFAGFFILMVLLILAASGAYLAEHQIQPEKFGSIPAAMWWSMATLTTVGYGDVTPVTVAGKIFGACVTIVGIGMAALPAGILANGLATQLNRKREVMAEQFRMALQDGNIDDQEADVIEELRKDLGVSVNVANGILETVQKNKVKTKLHFCPNCGESLSQYVKETV